MENQRKAWPMADRADSRRCVCSRLTQLVLITFLPVYTWQLSTEHSGEWITSRLFETYLLSCWGLVLWPGFCLIWAISKQCYENDSRMWVWFYLLEKSYPDLIKNLKQVRHIYWFSFFSPTSTSHKNYTYKLFYALKTENKTMTFITADT